jgi:light-regulated signal transduction histidine kinase (bacteriophytochrome)
LQDPLARFFDAQGFAMFDGETWTQEGLTPPIEALELLLNEATKRKPWGIFQTDCLTSDFPLYATSIPDICGITVGWCRTKKTKKPYYLVWTKQEAILSVRWGSRTTFPTSQDFSQSSPTTSFGQWQAHMSKHSAAWSKESDFVAHSMINTLMVS